MKIFELKKTDNINLQCNVIIENNENVIKKLKDELKNEKEINIIAKGPSTIYCENGHAINQALILTNKKYVYMNDFNSVLGIEEYIKDIKYFFMPFYPHLFGYVVNDFTYIDFIEYLRKHNFNGNVFIHQINNELNIKKLNKYRIKTATSTDLPSYIISNFLKLNCIFNTYGYKKKLLYVYGKTNLEKDKIGYHITFKKIYEKNSLYLLNYILPKTKHKKFIKEKYLRLENILKHFIFIEDNEHKKEVDKFVNGIEINKY
jgi:hypothetical protein